ncbi:hypothetical protein OSB04_018134 [Centaurea solstitialis]|uniref:DUF4220 domain-containing protein n=1 Tax=Centaurea solstitialis TaxID=347529 RepID=A0AA38WLE5_9ASTR|nr:hypothetical protein OSB04_018134 [Centaurea solstitialis]
MVENMDMIPIGYVANQNFTSLEIINKDNGIQHSLILVDQKRRLIEVFPDNVRIQWNKWELRGLVVISLALQISLILTGNRRKYIAKRRIRIFIWCAYLLADWIATVALGLLVDRQGNSVYSGDGNRMFGDLRLMAFWAPFLLLHLGGPDTITAYALADNELWLRHLLGLVVQTAAAVYITLLAWEDSLLSFLAVPMLLCGIIKYGERTWVLMSANREQFRDSVLTDRDPGPSYAKFMEEFCLKEAEGYHVAAAQIEEGNSPGEDVENSTPIGGMSSSNNSNGDRKVLRMADYFYDNLKFKRLFVDLILGFHPRDVSQSFFEKQDYRTAFEVIEVELGFAYDEFYTKAIIIHTPFGLFFRFITSFISFSVLLTFAAFIGFTSDHHRFIDVMITYILLIGAILLEAYAAISLVFSDWANLWFSQHASKIPLLSNLVLPIQSKQKGKRWSNSMYQFCLLDFCLNQKSSAFQEISRFIPVHKRLKNLWEKCESFRQLEHLDVSDELKSFIFDHFKKKSVDTDLNLKEFLTSRGAASLKAHKSYGTFKWTIPDVEFDHSILIWHIATDLCYNMDKSERGKASNGNKIEPWDDHMTHSKHLADYILYILVMCPFMLPIGIGMIRFRDTYAEALIFFEERSSTSKLEAYEMLGQVSTKVFPAKVKGDRSKSVLFEACKLAAALNEISDTEKMWKMVGDVWVEILGYAASQCRGFDHAQQLEKGGELLTHVWFLMAHLGITEHFKIEEGHGRVKLAVT